MEVLVTRSAGMNGGSGGSGIHSDDDDSANDGNLLIFKQFHSLEFLFRCYQYYHCCYFDIVINFFKNVKGINADLFDDNRQRIQAEE